MAYLCPVNCGAADKDETCVHHVLVHKQQQKVEAMETIVLSVAQYLHILSTACGQHSYA